MNLLMATGIQVFPQQSGGQLRSGNLAKSLARAGHDVFLYAYTGRRQDYIARRPSGSTSIEERLVEYVNRRPLGGLLQFLTYQLDLPNLWFSIPLKSLALDSVLKERIEWADAVILDFAFHTNLLPYTAHKPRLLNSANRESDIPYGKGWKRQWLRRRIDSVERRMGQNVDAILACGPTDEAFYRSVVGPTQRVIPVPNALDLRQLPPPNADERATQRRLLRVESHERVLLFTASRYTPNREAFECLRQMEAQHREELQRLGLVFLVVGSVTEARERAGNLITTGFVESTAPYYQAADFGLNPLTSGSGTNVKMFEYLAHRLPLVSTEFGVRGFDLTADEDYQRLNDGRWMETLRQVAALPRDVAAAKGARSFEKNRGRCDMDAVVREQVVPWLNALGSNAPAPVGEMPLPTPA